MNNKKMNNEQFSHLGEIPPNVNSILNIPIDLVDNRKLAELSVHFRDIQKRFPYNKEVVNASQIILGKIEGIISLWKTRASLEMMRAANDENYSVSLSA